MSALFLVELFIYFVFALPNWQYWLIVAAFDLVVYFASSIFIFRFLDEPLIHLISRVKHTAFTLKPVRRSPFKREFGEILKEVDRLAETLNRERGGLLETYSEYRNIVESLEEGILTVSPNGGIMMMNGGAEKIFSMRRSEWKGKKFEDFLRNYNLILDEMKGVITTKKLGKRLMIRKISIEMNGKPSLLYIFNDVTELSNLEKALNRAESLALLGKMTASIAHEIKTPIASLKLSVQLLRRQLGAVDSDTSETLEVLEREVRRLEGRAKGFLEFSNSKFELKSINVVDIVKESVKLARIRARERGITIDLGCDSEKITINGDENALNSAFMNVLVNGMDACSDNGKIRIGVRALSNSVRISFEDNGVGIAPDSLDYVFEPFFTLKNGGTGLGMSIVKRVIIAHGGKIDVESEEGKGTVITMWIPIGDANG